MTDDPITAEIPEKRIRTFQAIAREILWAARADLTNDKIQRRVDKSKGL